MKAGQIPLEGIEWQFVSPQGHVVLAEMAGNRLSGEVVRAMAKRRVVRGRGVYAKEVRYPGWAAFLKTFSGGTACKEGRISLALSESGIAVPEVLAFGVEKRNGLIFRDVLLTREEAQGKSLLEVMRRHYPMLPIREKCHLVEQFAAFIKKLHDAGIFHSDLHIGNILWVSQSEGGHRFVLLDTDRVSMKNRPLSHRERIDSLVLLLSNLWFLVSRSQRFRFLRCYGVSPGRTGRVFVEELAAKALQHSSKIWHWKAQRCLSNNSRFGRKKRSGFTVFFLKKEGIGDILDALLDDPDGLLESGRILKAGNTVRAARIELNGKTYFLKRFNYKGTIYRLKNTLRRSRAVRTWLVSWQFRVRGLPVPEPLVCLEERRLGLLGRSYLLSRFIEDSLPLPMAWGRSDPSARRDLLGRLGLLLGRLHYFGGLHGDLKWNNILVGGKGSWGLYLTDFDGSSIIGQGKLAVKRKDLERFFVDMEKIQVPEADRAFFFKCWKRWFP